MNDTITAEIRSFVVNHRENRIPDGSGPIFDEPLVGFAAFTDPLFVRYQEIIGPFHLTPTEILVGEVGATEEEVGTVICYVLPVTEAVRKSNRSETTYPSRQWSWQRQYGEVLNGRLRYHLVTWLTEQGHRAAIPQYSPLWKEFRDTPVGVASTWSERHAAYAAGLGTFSLNDGLITEKGIAHRLGSVVTDLVLTPTPRTALDHRHNCLFYRKLGSCGVCARRCPVGALTPDGHDKSICREHVYGTIPAAVAEEYHVTATGCGLCQTAVPCEFRVP
jgi:epoxyqueuosine reductase QueG